MRREKKKIKFSFVFISLLTVFFVSFSCSAWIIINANKLVFADNYEQYKSIMDNMQSDENKDAKIVDLEEQVERYKELYESASEENRALINTNSELNARLNKLSKPASKPETPPASQDENSSDTSDSENTSEGNTGNITQPSENEVPDDKGTDSVTPETDEDDAADSEDGSDIKNSDDVKTEE